MREEVTTENNADFSDPIGRGVLELPSDDNGNDSRWEKFSNDTYSHKKIISILSKMWISRI